MTIHTFEAEMWRDTTWTGGGIRGNNWAYEIDRLIEQHIKRQQTGPIINIFWSFVQDKRQFGPDVRDTEYWSVAIATVIFL